MRQAITNVLTVLPLALMANFGSAQPAAPRRPAALFIGGGRASCGYDVASRLDKAGFALGTVGKELDQEALTRDDVKSYNVLVIYDLGRCNADMALPQWTQDTIATVRRFLEVGGGVLYVPRFGQMATEAPAQEAWLGRGACDKILTAAQEAVRRVEAI